MRFLSTLDSLFPRPLGDKKRASWKVQGFWPLQDRFILFSSPFDTMLGLPRVDRYGGSRHSRGGERYHPYYHSGHVSSPSIPRRLAEQSDEVTLHSHHDHSAYNVQLEYPQYAQEGFNYHQLAFEPGQQYENSTYYPFPGEEPSEQKPSVHAMASESAQTPQTPDEHSEQRIHHPPPKERRFKLSR